LAERSQAAAKEISELAKNSVIGADEAGQMIEGIVPDIKRTAELIQEITVSCQEQSNGVSQIRDAMTSLDQVTQQNSASAEESAAASEELASQAQTVQDRLSLFRIRANGNGSASLGNKGTARLNIPHEPIHGKKVTSQIAYQSEDEFQAF
ncbi:hypothetical protein GF373_09415, partial [bacterium]|nr:hypothetical protein [bacterium]